MTAEHFNHVILALLDREPFRRFAVELHGGERFEIDHPRVTVIRDGVAVYLKPGNIPVYFDHESTNQVIDDRAGTDANPEP